MHKIRIKKKLKASNMKATIRAHIMLEFIEHT